MSNYMCDNNVNNLILFLDGVDPLKNMIYCKGEKFRSTSSSRNWLQRWVLRLQGYSGKKQDIVSKIQEIFADVQSTDSALNQGVAEKLETLQRRFSKKDPKLSDVFQNIITQFRGGRIAPLAPVQESAADGVRPDCSTMIRMESIEEIESPEDRWMTIRWTLGGKYGLTESDLKAFPKSLFATQDGFDKVCEEWCQEKRQDKNEEFIEKYQQELGKQCEHFNIPHDALRIEYPALENDPYQVIDEEHFQRFVSSDAVRGLIEKAVCQFIQHPDEQRRIQEQLLQECAGKSLHQVGDTILRHPEICRIYTARENARMLDTYVEILFERRKQIFKGTTKNQVKDLIVPRELLYLHYTKKWGKIPFNDYVQGKASLQPHHKEILDYLQRFSPTDVH